MARLLLVRHGQASFGAADYDRLSPLGEQQARRLGAWLKQAGQHPDLVAMGRMRRHVQTAELCLEAAGVQAPRLEVPGLDELDHVEILARHRPDLTSFEALRTEMGRAADPHRAFQQLYRAAIGRWASGEFDADYSLPWEEFRHGVLHGLQVLASSGAQHIWAFTSGGPMAVIVNDLVGAPPQHAFALAWPIVNTGLIRIAFDGSSPSLVSYNSWPHLGHGATAHLVTHR
jgi:broad specificity phosphatase PhoE